MLRRAWLDGARLRRALVDGRSFLAFALALTVLSACGGSHSVPAAPVSTTIVSHGSGAASSGTFAYDASFVRAAELLGPATFANLSIDVALPMQNAAGLASYATSVSDPSSSNYRHFLTPDEIASRFDASAADQAKAVAYFRSYGLRVGTWRQRMLVNVAGTQAQLAAAFHTTFGTYRNLATGETFFAPQTAPSVAAAVPVVGSANIVFRTKRYSPQFALSPGNGLGLAPQQIAAAFDYNGAYAAGYTGSGIAVGIIATGPVQTSTGGKIGDAEAYKALYHVSGASGVTIVSATSSDPVVNGASGFSSPPPVTGPCVAPAAAPTPLQVFPEPKCNPEDPNNPEAQLDVEQAASLARDASIEFYLSYNPDDGCVTSSGVPVQNQPCPPVGSSGGGIAQQGLAEYEEEIQTAIDRNTADVISESFGGAEFSTVGSSSPPAPFTSDGSGLDPTMYEMLVAEGVAIFAASGDSGAQGCQPTTVTGKIDSLCVQYPASDPNITAVGGVTTPVNGAGQLVGPITAWGLSTSDGFDGSGGGVSAYFPLPSWQQGAAGVIGSMRNVPDDALNGDPATGVSVLIYGDPSFGGRTIEQVGGTSVAAPEMASMWALVLQACKQTPSCVAGGSGAHPYRLGNPAPLLYAIYKNRANVYASTFLSITYGDNALLLYCYQLFVLGQADPTDCPPGASPPPETLDPGYSASSSGGYNQVTGLGVPFARALIKAVVGV